MLKNRSNLLAVFTVVILILLPISYFIVSYQLESRNDEEALLKRLTFIGGSIQRFIKLPDHPAGLIAEIDEAFSSAEEVYPDLLKPSEEEAALSRDYFAFKACWERVQQAAARAPETLKKEGELCWLQGNKAIFDLHYVMEQRSKSMLDSLFMLGLFGTLLILYLLYQIYRYVHVDLENHQMIDLPTGLYNTNAFLQECAVGALSSNRNRSPFSAVLMKFDKKNNTQKQIDDITRQLKRICRREEKLFHLSDASFALLTADAKSSELGPLIDRLQKNLSECRYGFAVATVEFSPGADAEAFGAACLSRLDAMKV